MKDTPAISNPAGELNTYWTIFASLVLIFAAAWTWFSRAEVGSISRSRPPAPHPGFAAPNFALATASGETMQLSDLQGQVVIVNVWATWCPPCRAEMPAMQKIYTAYQGQGLEVVAVNAAYSDSPAKAVEFAEELGLTFPIVFDLDGGTARQYRINSLPTTFFIDRQGIIRDVVIGGPLSEALLRIRVEELLASEEGD